MILQYLRSGIVDQVLSSEISLESLQAEAEWFGLSTLRKMLDREQSKPPQAKGPRVTQAQLEQW